MNPPLLRALHPLDAPPSPPGWNHAELADLLGEAPRTPAAVLVPVFDGAEPALLFTRRTEHLRHHAGQVAFPGGRIEAADAGAVEAALRESEEEIGLARDAVRPLGYLDCFETVSGFCVTPVVARVARGTPLRPHPGEVAEVFEVPLTFFLDPANLHTRRMDYRGRPREVYEFRHGGHVIWGVTAGILVNLLRRMGTP
ncbi:NTP pyrophosphohydrolase [Mizugakiibacter sediminis]|uniref:NTP pyrophosphohydrolase n=1 Tax=Mizugakiibacter sediminis TaxID=1475481 RepID=A0A0K8QR89_9GAMM|nr:NTP pyrophosphohydrolase [Mizugakiibacter sediminis]